jgi:hypothetical protein
MLPVMVGDQQQKHNYSPSKNVADVQRHRRSAEPSPLEFGLSLGYLGANYMVMKLLPIVPATQPPIFGPQYDLGGVTLSVIQMEHTTEDWKAHGEELTQRLLASDGVIPEYTKFDRNGDRNPMVRFALALIRSRSVNYVFDRLDEQYPELTRDVWMVDPAYSPWWEATFQGLVGGAEVLPRLLAIETLGSAVLGKHWPSGSLGWVASVGLTFTTLGQTAMVELERQTRAIIAAHNLCEAVRLGEYPSGASLAMVLPAALWEPKTGRPGIKFYLEHPHQRERLVGRFQTVFNQHHLFCQRRHHQFEPVNQVAPDSDFGPNL